MVFINDFLALLFSEEETTRAFSLKSPGGHYLIALKGNQGNLHKQKHEGQAGWKYDSITLGNRK